MPDAQPIHTAQLGLGAVRFFRPPGPCPDFPWHAVDDLYAALGLAPELKTTMMDGLFRHWRDEITTVDTGTERLVIGPHWQALGLVGAMDEVLNAGETGQRAYVKVAAAAAEAMLAGLGPIERFQYMMAAAKAGMGENVDAH